MANQLSFAPKFHREVALSNMNGWILIQFAGFDPLRHVREIVEEQKRIENESGAIITFDPKQ